MALANFQFKHFGITVSDQVANGDPASAGAAATTGQGLGGGSSQALGQNQTVTANANDNAATAPPNKGGGSSWLFVSNVWWDP